MVIIRSFRKSGLFDLEEGEIWVEFEGRSVSYEMTRLQRDGRR
jgi:hypothetical protein